MKIAYLLIALVAILVGAGFLVSLPVRTEHAFICDNTGSRYGYAVTRFGGQKSKWYEKSALETFMETKHPSELQHRWITYGRTGKNIFGRTVAFSCGPRPALFSLKPAIIDEFCERASDDEKLSAYRAFAGSGYVQGKKIAEVLERILGPTSDPASGGAATNATH